MDYYVGLDVSLRSVAVCVINADGKLIFERSVACEIEDIVECLRDVPAMSGAPSINAAVCHTPSNAETLSDIGLSNADFPSLIVGT